MSTILLPLVLQVKELEHAKGFFIGGSSPTISIDASYAEARAVER